MGQPLGRCMKNTAVGEDTLGPPLKGTSASTVGIQLTCAAEAGDVSAVQRALDAGAEVNAVNYDCSSALHLAAARGHVGVVECLLKAGAEVNLKDRRGSTAFDRSADSDSAEVQSMLVAAGGRSGMELEKRQADSWESVASMASGSTASSSPHAASAALCAAAANSLALLQKMHDKGVALDVADDRGRTPLHVACSHGHLELVRWLVSAGADVNSEDSFGRTPLGDASRNRHKEVVAFLRGAGARSADLSELRRAAEAGNWAIPKIELELGAEMSVTAKSRIFRATWRGSQVVCKSTAALSTMRSLSEFSVADDKSQATSLKEIMHEVQLLAKLRHPDLVLILGACVDRTPPLLVIEYMEGGNLERYYENQAKKSGQPFRPPRERLVKWAASVARGLAYLHDRSQPIIHRDVNPSNLLLDRNLELKVTDFGLSRLIEEPCPSGRMQALMSQVVVGSRYMAPEVIRGEHCGDRSDVYSLGLVMWFMCVGRQPFVGEFGEDVDKVSQAFLRGDEPRPHASAMKCPNGFRELIQECWHVVPSRRPAAKESAERLVAL